MEPISIIIAFFAVLAALIVGIVACSHKRTRIVFGIMTLAWASLMFITANEVQTYNLNAWYGAAAARMIDSSIAAIDSGKHQELNAGLKKMRDNLIVTYENRGNFKELADKLSFELAQNKEAQQAAPRNR